MTRARRSPMSVAGPGSGVAVVRRRRRALLEHALMIAGASKPVSVATYVKTLTALGLAIPASGGGYPIARRPAESRPTASRPTAVR
jgi:hypothetical protein